MYFQIGKPKRLSSLPVVLQDKAYLKRHYQIAVIDDEAFVKADALRAHRFNLVELGDIRTVDQVAEFPIVVCDIRGVGGALDCSLEGAHLLSEIRKAYPDKFLVSYTGAHFDASYNESLKGVDVSLNKDSPTEHWVSTLENGLEKVGNPKERWIRMRKMLLEKGVELHDIFEMEQRFIQAVEKRDASKFKVEKVPEEIKEIAITFARISLIQIIKSYTNYD